MSSDERHIYGMRGERLYVDTVLREHVALASELLTSLRSASLEGTGPDSLDDLWARAEANSAFDELPQRLRSDVYLRERALAKNAPDWELDTWPMRQRQPK